MIPKQVFDKIAALGLSQEHFMSLITLLFEAVESTIEKTTASYAKQFLEVVESTEAKIFARIAQEAAEAEEKKRLRREAIAARKAAKAASTPVKKEGVAAAPDARFQGSAGEPIQGDVPSPSQSMAGEDIREADNALIEAGAATVEATPSSKEKQELNQEQTKVWTPDMEGYDPEIAAKIAAKNALKKELATVKVGDIWKDGSPVSVVTPEYCFIRTQRDEDIEAALQNAHVRIYTEAYDEIFHENYNYEMGDFYPEMNEDKISDLAYEEANRQAQEIEYNLALQWDRDHGIDVNAPDYAPRPPNMGWEKYGKDPAVKKHVADPQDDPLTYEVFEGLFPGCYDKEAADYHKELMQRYLTYQEQKDFCQYSASEKEWLIDNLVARDNFPVEERLIYIKKMMDRAHWDAKKWAENNISFQPHREAFMARASYEAALKLAKYDNDPVIQERLLQIEEDYSKRNADTYAALIKTPEGKIADQELAGVVKGAM